MKKLLALVFLLFASPAWAQNPQCPTRPAGDSTNACASTAFVQAAIVSQTTTSVTITGSDAHVIPALNTSAFLRLTNTNTSSNFGAQVQFGSVVGNPYVVIGTYLIDGTSPGAGRLVFATKDDTTSPLVNRLWFNNGGQLFSGNDFDAQNFGGRYSFGAYNNFGYQAIIGYSKTSDLNPVGVNTQHTAGGYFFADNDFVGTTENPAAYGTYAEVRCSNAFSCLGIEVDAQNTSGVAGRPIDPNNIFGTDSTKPWVIAHWISANGSKVGPAEKDVSAAIGINAASASKTFEKGIVFQAGSVVGATSHSQAVAMPALYEFAWYKADGTLTGTLFSNATTDALVWNNTGSAAQFEIATGNTARAVLYGDSTQVLTGSVTNIPVSLLVNNAAVMQLLTAGNVKFNNAASFSANASVATVLGSVGPVGSHTTVQKWLTIVDSGGATLYIPAF